MGNKPKWLNKEVSTRQRSDKQEKRLAKQFGGRTTSNSGATFSENDVKTPEFDIEAKTTKSKQFIVKLEDLKKMQRKTRVDKKPLFAINFEETGDEFILISLSDFLEITSLQGLK